MPALSLDSDKGVLPSNPLWQDRWYLQPSSASGRCFSCQKLRCTFSSVSLTCSWRTWTVLPGVWALYSSLVYRGCCCRHRNCSKRRKQSCNQAGNFLVCWWDSPVSWGLGLFILRHSCVYDAVLILQCSLGWPQTRDSTSLDSWMLGS